MKIRIKVYNGELPSYLTVGRFYDVLCGVWDGMVLIRNNNGGDIVIVVDECDHLNGGSWEIVNDAGF